MGSTKISEACFSGGYVIRYYYDKIFVERSISISELSSLLRGSFISIGACCENTFHAILTHPLLYDLDANSGYEDGVETKRARKKNNIPSYATIDNEEQQPVNTLESTSKRYRQRKKLTVDVLKRKVLSGVDCFEPKLLVIEGSEEQADYGGMKKRKKVKDKKTSKSEREGKVQEIEELNHEIIKAEMKRSRKRKRKDSSEVKMHDCYFQVRDKKTKQEVKTFHRKGKTSKNEALNVEAKQHKHQKQDNGFAELSSRLKQGEHQQLGLDIGIAGAGKPSTRHGVSALGNARSGVIAIVKHKKTTIRKKKGNAGGDFEFVLKSSTLHSEIGVGNESSW